MTILRNISPPGWVRITAGLFFAYIVALVAVQFSGGRWLAPPINLALVVLLATAVTCSVICAVVTERRPKPPPDDPRELTVDMPTTATGVIVPPPGWNARTSVQGALYRSRGRHVDRDRDRDHDDDWATQILEGLQPRHLDPPRHPDPGDVSESA